MTNIRHRPTVDHRAEGAVPAPYRPLLDRFSTELEQSFDVFHIALVLESSGVSDRTAVDEHDADDVVDLAATLSRLVPYRAVPPDARPRATLRARAESLARGWAFVLAGMTAMTAAAAVGGRAAAPVLLVATMVATAAMSPLSFLAHLAVQRAGPARVRAALGPLYRWGLAAVVVPGVAISAVAGLQLALLAVGPLVYALAAVTVLVARRSWVFAAAVAPGGLASVACLASDGRLVAARWAAVLTASGLGLLAPGVLVAVGRRGRLEDQLGPFELRAARPFLWSGVTAAAFMGAFLAVLTRLQPMEEAGSRGWFVAAWPLFTLLGLSDAAATGLRERTRSAAHVAVSTAELAVGVRRATGRFWATMGTAAAVAVAASTACRPAGGWVLSGLVATSFALAAAVLVGRMADPDPYDPVGPGTVAVLAAALAGLAVTERWLGPTVTVATTAGVVLIGFLGIGGTVWRRSTGLSAHRWSL